MEVKDLETHLARKLYEFDKQSHDPAWADIHDGIQARYCEAIRMLDTECKALYEQGARSGLSSG